MAGALRPIARDAQLRWLPVHPARRRTTVTGRSPGSRIAAAPRLPAPRLRSAQWLRGARLPGHSCGGSPGFEPGSLGELALTGPASRAIRDVTRQSSHRSRAVQHWHAANAARAAGPCEAYPRGQPWHGFRLSRRPAEPAQAGRPASDGCGGTCPSAPVRRRHPSRSIGAPTSLPRRARSVRRQRPRECSAGRLPTPARCRPAPQPSRQGSPVQRRPPADVPSAW
jgi:hypothetical protein